VADLALRIRTRLLPALLTALGVAFLASGLLTYTVPVEAGAQPTDPPTIVTLAPTPSPSPTVVPASVQPTPTFAADRVATRIVIPDLGIDLPVVRPPETNEYPLCDVAEFIQTLGQPGQGRATYLYAHARKGMFLPLLDSSKIENGKKMLGMAVQVYTSDDMLFVYEITQVRRHQLTLDDAVGATTEQLWLQTSEGPAGTKPKLQVVAMPVGSQAADHASAHPTPKPRVCG
jgi:sortase (surface protein transpeptidase)